MVKILKSTGMLRSERNESTRRQLLKNCAKCSEKPPNIKRCEHFILINMRKKFFKISFRLCESPGEKR